MDIRPTKTVILVRLGGSKVDIPFLENHKPYNLEKTKQHLPSRPSYSPPRHISSISCRILIYFGLNAYLQDLGLRVGVGFGLQGYGTVPHASPTQRSKILETERFMAPRLRS